MSRNSIKKIVCIECPNGCMLSVTLKGGKTFKVTGNKCIKGEKYAHAEINNPVRILTSAVAVLGPHIKMLPVKTDRPIPKSRLIKAMKEIKKTHVKRPVRSGKIIIKNFLNLKVNLVATRNIF